MFSAPIPEPTPESELSLAAAAEALDRTTRGIDARFVRAGEALAQAYGIVENLVTALEGVTNAMGRDAADAAVENMRATADRLERLPAVQAARETALAHIQQTAKPLRDNVGQIKRTLDFLRICGLNIKVAAAGANGFSDFADTMFARIDVGEAEIAAIALEIDRLMTGIPAVVEVDRQLAAECSKVIPHVPRKLAADAAALQAHQAGDAAMATRIAEAARAIRAKVATAIGAMQIGDITRQRLEHVADGVRALLAYRSGESGASSAEADETPGEAVPTPPDEAVALLVSGHMIALLAAQAMDTIDAFQGEARLLADSVRGIAPSAMALLEVRGEQGGESDRAGADRASFLADLERSVREIATVTAQLREADLRANGLGGEISDAGERLAQRLTTVHRVNHDVHLMAWNTDLRCHRMGTDGRALAMVASEIRGFAHSLATISRAISTSIETLATAVTEIRGPDGQEGDVGEALTESLACIRDGGQRLRDSLAGLDRDAATVADILRETTANIDCEAEFGSDLAGVVNTLSMLASPCEELPDEAVAAALQPLLDGMARSYTMAREREIHRRFALDAGGETEADTGPAAMDDDDDDDGLF